MMMSATKSINQGCTFLRESDSKRGLTISGIGLGIRAITCSYNNFLFIMTLFFGSPRNIYAP